MSPQSLEPITEHKLGQHIFNTALERMEIPSFGENGEFYFERGSCWDSVVILPNFTPHCESRHIH